MLKTAGSASIKFIRGSKLAESKTTGVVAKGIYVKKDVGEKFGKNEYHIREASDDLIVINASGNLDFRFEEVPVGSYVEITYEGKTPLPKGKFAGTLAHQWKVQYGPAELAQQPSAAATKATEVKAEDKKTGGLPF